MATSTSTQTTSPSGKYLPVGECCGKTYFHRSALARHTRTKHATTWSIEWGAFNYDGFTSEAEARAFQREHELTGSSIVRVG